ncbi:MAG: hypothetical protein H8E98_05525 [Bacteroidetes bacterium]|nr:hypothetical protein [Bacteroidota bacterium]
MEFKQVKKAKSELHKKYKKLFEEEELTFNAFITKRDDEYVLYVLVEECTEEAKLFTKETIPKSFEYEDNTYRVIREFGTHTMIKQ